MKIHGERTGCIGVAISHALATEMIACILGLRTEDLEADEVPGGICEVLNVITGNAKARLKGTPFHFEISPPELDTDKFMQCLSPCTLVHLKTGEEHFDLLIALENA
jgi:CheY-specific phosphatase CheX